MKKKKLQQMEDEELPQAGGMRPLMTGTRVENQSLIVSENRVSDNPFIRE
jgi:hypothetical protein